MGGDKVICTDRSRSGGLVGTYNSLKQQHTGLCEWEAGDSFEWMGLQGLHFPLVHFWSCLEGTYHFFTPEFPNLRAESTK